MTGWFLPNNRFHSTHVQTCYKENLNAKELENENIIYSRIIHLKPKEAMIYFCPYHT